jgi:2-methylcitrate dehydratase PrpD
MGEDEMNETKELAEFISNFQYSDLDSEVIEKAKSLILDQLGCQIAFAGISPSKEVYRYIRGRKGGHETSTIVYYGLRTNSEDTAFANAVFGHGFEMDDTEMHSITHPGAVIIPSALAVGEAELISGKEFIASVVAGYEVMLRVGMAARLMINKAFHGTCAAGTFGAAATAGKILRFDKEKMTNAIGIAGSQSGGIAEYAISGGTVKRLHPGFAAHSGVRASFLAQIGLTGPSTVLEGKKGFCQAFAGEHFPKEITADLGKHFRILWTGNKPYCCCAGQHTSIDAVSEILIKRPIKISEIKNIEIAQGAREVGNVGNIIEPHDIVSAQFCGRFGVALRLVKGSNGVNDYTMENIKNPEIMSLIKKTNYIIDEKFDNLPPGSAPSKVIIRLKDGSSFEETIDYAKGTIQNPMTKMELESKFKELTSRVFPKRQVESIMRTVSGLEDVENIHQLSSRLIAGGGN